MINMIFIQVITKAILEAREWEQAQSAKETDRKKWYKPQATTNVWTEGITINFDAAWETTNNKAGLGWIMKNEEGITICENKMWKSHVASPLAAEALALREAVQQSRRRSILRAEFRTDSSIIIKALKTQEYPKTIYGILRDVKVLAQSFEKVRFIHVPREENQTADALAKYALGIACNS